MVHCTPWLRAWEGVEGGAVWCGWRLGLCERDFADEITKMESTKECLEILQEANLVDVAGWCNVE